MPLNVSNALWVLRMVLIFALAIRFQCRMNQELPRYPPETLSHQDAISQ